MNFYNVHISRKAVELASATLRSGNISEGERVREFEVQLAKRLGLSFPVALNSGTSALHLALITAGVGPGDEVILPAQTFVASAHAIMMCGAVPVFADIQRFTGNLDPISLRQHISARTKAVMPVHWGGYPCDMEEINAIAGEHDIAVVEDAAHALGATYKGTPIGAVSRFTAFSFQAIKHLTTGDGGLLCCLREEDYHVARRRRWFGIDRERDRQSLLGERVYDLGEVGFKYHMNDIAAAIGLGNLSDLPKNLRRHRDIARLYRSSFDGVPGLQLLECRHDRQGAYWIYSLLVEKRQEFIIALRERGVPASVVHQRIDRNRIFGGIRKDLAAQAFFDERHVALPIHAALSDEQVESTIAAVKQGW